MKHKLLTAICSIMTFIPWTILPLRTNAWALESPIAEMMIISYAVFMIFSGIFTITTYVKARIQTNLMRFCLMINGLYAVAGAAILVMLALPKFI